MSTEAIATTTAGGASGYISVAAGASIQVYTVPNLGFRETVDVYRTDDDTVDVFVGRALSEGEPSAIISGPGRFKFIMSATAASTALNYDA